MAASRVRRTVVVTTGIGAAAAVTAHLLLWSHTAVDLGPLSVAVELGVGLLWLFAAAVVLVMRPGNRIGPLLVIGGVLWLLQGARMSTNGWLYTVGSGTVFAHLPVLQHVMLAFPSGRLRSRAERAVVAAGYAATVVCELGFVTSATGCYGYLPGCPGLPPVVGVLAEHRSTVAWAEQLIFTALVVPGLVLLVRRLLRTIPLSRRVVAPGLLLGMVALPGFWATALDVPSIAPVTIVPRHAPAYYLLSGLLPVGVVVGLAWARWRRGTVGPLVVALDQGLAAPGLRDALARCLGDPTLRVALPDGAGGFVDEHGQPARPGADPSRASTPVQSGGRTIALLEHDPTLRDHPELVAGAVSASRLALENARLTAQVHAQLAELRASRRRLVAAVDAGRRRLERDLHDGAQQQLLGVAIDLARARDAARHGDHTSLDKLFAETTERLDDAMTELRRLARGIHPPILTERGLTAALEALAVRAPLPVELHGTCPRMPAPVETTAYFVASEALANAVRHARAQYVTVQVEHRHDLLRVEVHDDGCGGAVPRHAGGLEGLADRVAAEDGSLVLRSPPGAGTVVRAELPIPTAEAAAAGGSP